jgi:16S rRNA (guanine(966)-N(2))-methyltransferase RsmD
VIKAPKGVDLRPTEERVRQALFNILGPNFPGSRVLELFCGSGAMGLEALSRGASFVLFSDKDRRCVESAKTHTEQFKFPAEEAEFICSPAERVIASLIRRGESFDLIFMDPPYESDEGLGALRLIGEADKMLLNAGGRLILEHRDKVKVPEREGRLGLLKQYSYGSSVLSFYLVQDAN